MANVFDVASWFWLLEDSKEEGLTNLKLQKLCYYAQGLYLAKYGERLFKDDMEAWKHGPVVPALYEKLQSCGRVPIESTMLFQNSSDIKLCDKEKDLIEDVFTYFGEYTAWKLADLTHEEDPWINANKRENKLITDEDLVAYFKNKVGEYILDAEEEKMYQKAMKIWNDPNTEYVKGEDVWKEFNIKC